MTETVGGGIVPRTVHYELHIGYTCTMPTETTIRIRKLIDQRRADWLASQGGCCAKCGSTDRLEVDHIDRATKTLEVRNIWTRRQDIREAELAKCQVLCHACHKIKTNSERHEWVGVAEHGGPWMYSGKKCRCAECKAGHARRARERNQRKREGAFVDKRFGGTSFPA